MLRLSLAFCLAAAPALAQDEGAQFAAAVRAFTLPGVPGYDASGLQDDAAVLALLPTLAGSWAPALNLFLGPDGYDDDLLAQACENSPTEFAPTAPRSFELRRTSGGEGEVTTLAIRHDWIIGNTFDRSVEETQAIAYLGLDNLPDIPPGMLQLPGLRGDVVMFHPSDDILVFVMPGSPPEIFARCP